jgi:WXXGXW repeat (2 copies)
MILFLKELSIIGLMKVFFMKQNIALLFFISLFACDPYLKEKTIKANYFKSSRQCSQGPFVLKTTTSGNRWGETAKLIIYSKKKIKFRVNVILGNKPLGRERVIGYKPENEYCFAKKGEKTGRGNIKTKGSGGVSGKTEKPENIPGKNQPGQLKVKVELVSVNKNEFQTNTTKTYYEPGTTVKKRYHNYSTTILFSKIQDLINKNPYKRGVPVVVTIWSELPNDLQGVYFKWIHSSFTPNNKKKWIKFLRKKVSDEKRKAEKREKRRVENERKLFLLRLKVCRIYKDSKGLEWKVCRQFYKTKIYRKCLRKHIIDKTCWGTHLKSVNKKRYYRPKPVKRVYKPVKIIKIKKVKKVTQGPFEISVFLVDPPLNPTKKIKITKPDSPPPAPLKAVKTLKPSQNAKWIHGYWRWSGKIWFWLSGFWRVPKSDITNRKTQKAPKLPPIIGVEKKISAKPFHDALWAPGYWMWRPGGYIWIKGRWILSRGTKYRWSPPKWRKTPFGIFFIPGKWISR